MYWQVQRAFSTGAALLLLSVALTAQAQEEAANATPRAVVRSFLDAARHGDYEQAAKLAFPQGGTGPGFSDPATTARQLKAVLDYELPVDLQQLSDDPSGRLDDRLNPEYEELGRVVGPNNRSESVRLTRYTGSGWFFSPTTLNKVSGWYQSLPDRWLREHLPEPLFRAGPRDVLWWQWLALPILLLVSFTIGWLLAAITRFILGKLFHRENEPNHEFLSRLTGPFTLVIAVMIARGLLVLLVLTVPAEQFFDAFLSALLLLAVFWAALRSVDFGIQWLRGSGFGKDHPERVALLPLFSRTAKIAIGIFAVVAALQKLGYPAASLIAGLGIGGLAFALAAQKTIENLFGSVILSVDQPFRPGDFVKVEDLLGTVETIGLRSTRIRTLERTMVTLPNGRLADMRIETFAARDRFRLYFVIGLVHSTTSEQLRKIMEEIAQLLTTSPDMFPGAQPEIFFTALGANSFDIEIIAWVNTKDGPTFKRRRQELYLGIMQIVERNGSSFALPARVVHMAAEKKAG